MRYLVECLGYSAFILEFYIAIDIILICLSGDCSITKLKLRDPYKSYEIVPLNWPFSLYLDSYYVASNLNTQNAIKISFDSNYIKLYNLCNLLVHIHQSQSSESLLIHSIASIFEVFSQCTVYMTL